MAGFASSAVERQHAMNAAGDVFGTAEEYVLATEDLKIAARRLVLEIAKNSVYAYYSFCVLVDTLHFNHFWEKRG